MPLDALVPARWRPRGGQRYWHVTVLKRIVDGLGVPRAFMRLSGGADGPYPGGDAVTESP
ncbi:MAG: hypothetical protein ACRDTD_04570 [Pseudonocardiaceae bacterium]